MIFVIINKVLHIIKNQHDRATIRIKIDEKDKEKKPF